MSLAVLDLFAGCGGLSLGLRQAGFSIAAAVEKDEWAADTYAYNHSETELYRRDIATLDSAFLRKRFRGEIDLVAGGPPCQGFSVSGKRQHGVFLEKNRLIHDFIRTVEAVEPPLFLLENVRGFTTASIDGTAKALAVLLSGLRSLGYTLYNTVVQAADYGVPQYRSRLFVIGARRELPASPFPCATHAPEGSGPLSPYRSIMEAISDLPCIQAGQGSDDFQSYSRTAHNDYQALMRDGAVGVCNHQAMRHTPRLVKRFAVIPPGGSAYKAGTSGVIHRATVYKSNNQRLVATLPSLCITANFQSTYVHPILNRNLTAREAARIQTFPDTFVLKGRRTLMSSTLLAAEGRHAENHLSQYNQVGNAVPPLLACALGQRLAELSSSRRPRTRTRAA